MNSNETIRNAGTARAIELTQQYSKIIQEHTFSNFDMAYYDFPCEEVEKIWHDRGGETWELIEPVDGFHPSQTAMALTAEVLYNKLQTDHPSFLGPIIPNNAQIEKIFADQGGY